MNPVEGYISAVNPTLYKTMRPAFASANEIPLAAKAGIAETLLQGGVGDTYKALYDSKLKPAFDKFGISIREPNYHALSAAVAAGMVTMPQAFSMALQLRNAQVNLLSTMMTLKAQEEQSQYRNMAMKTELLRQQQIKASTQRSNANLIKDVIFSLRDAQLDTVNAELQREGIDVKAFNNFLKQNGITGTMASATLAKKMRDPEFKKQYEAFTASVNDPQRLVRIRDLWTQSIMVRKAAAMAYHDSTRDLLAGNAQVIGKLGDYWDIAMTRVMDETARGVSKDRIKMGEPLNTTGTKDFLKMYFEEMEGLDPKHADTLAGIASKSIDISAQGLSGLTPEEITKILVGHDEYISLADKMFDRAQQITGDVWALTSGVAGQPTEKGIQGYEDLLNDPELKALVEAEPKDTAGWTDWYTPPSEYPLPEGFQQNVDDMGSILVGSVRAVKSLVDIWKKILGTTGTKESKAIEAEWGGPPVKKEPATRDVLQGALSAVRR